MIFRFFRVYFSLSSHDTVMGTEVRTVLSVRKQTVGKHQYEINASSLKTGIYILKVIVGSEIQTRKLSILK